MNKHCVYGHFGSNFGPQLEMGIDLKNTQINSYFKIRLNYLYTVRIIFLLKSKAKFFIKV